MAIASYKPNALLNNELTTDTLPKYDTVLISDRDTSVDKLVQYVEGSIWQVNYYSQIVSGDDPLLPHDASLPDVLQQYLKINNFVIRVTSDLTGSSNEDKSMVVTGSGTYVNNVPPNIGDMFTAVIGDNRTAIFTVTSTNRKSYNKRPVYDIEYILSNYTDVSVGAVRLIDMDSKVVKNLYYSGTTLSSGLVESEEMCRNTLKCSYSSILDHYVGSFLDRQTSNLVIPGQQFKIVDMHVTNFLSRVTSVSDHIGLQNIHKLNLSDDKYMDQPTVWTAMLQRSSTVLKYCNWTMQLASRTSFSGSPLSTTVRYTKIDYVVYPDKPDLRSDIQSTNIDGLVPYVLTPVPSSGPDIDELLDQASVQGVEVRIPSISELTHYVFSEAFYTQDEVNSVLEHMVLAYLNKTPPNVVALQDLADQYFRFGKLEQFYYGPILLMLVKNL